MPRNGSFDRGSDNGEDANPNREDGGVFRDVFSPGVITRLQYAMYLFVGLVVCLILKGSAGKTFQSFEIFRRGCQFLQEESKIQTIEKWTHGDFAATPAPGESTTESIVSLACFENTLVYRVSFSLAVFFLVHLVSVSDATCCVEASARAKMQEKFFSFKTMILTLLLITTFTVVPNHFFAGYAWVCMAVSAVFLVIQVILLVDFSYQWNDDWGQRAEQNSKWQVYLALVAGGSYLVGIVMCILSFVYFVPHSDCNFNAFAITTVLVIPGLISTLVAVWVPHGSIVPSGIVFAYCATMEFVTLRSSQDMYCNAFPGAADTGSVKSVLISSVFSGLVLAYTVVSSSGNRTALTLEADEVAVQTDADEDGHLSGYLYFHAIMLMGSMYMAMLVSDWQVSGGDNGAISAGAGSVHNGLTAAFWVKHSSLWLTMVAYLWTLLAPYYCCSDRDFGIETDDW